MPSRFICDCGIEIAHVSYYKHINCEKHIKLIELLLEIKELKKENKLLLDLYHKTNQVKN
jgi:hypothetical protein